MSTRSAPEVTSGATSGRDRSHPSTVAGTRPRVLFLNRSYWPDGEATGQLLTELTEDLAGKFEVTAVVGLPNANPSGESFRLLRSDVRNSVRILRVPHTRFPKGWLPGRAVNFLSFLFAATLRGLFCLRQDIVVVETDPFLLAFVGLLLRARHRARLVIYLQDIHPDVGVAVGVLRDGRLVRLMRRLLVGVYRRSDRVVVLSRDMCETLRGAGVPERIVERLPNWVDTNLVRPPAGPNRFRERSGIDADAFLVMYSGNLGATQRLENLLEVADRLRTNTEILFLFVGGGSAEASLRAEADRRGLTNVRFLPYRPKSELGDSLAAADLHVISVHPAVLKYLMPSKLYGILASGRPVLAVAPEGTELATEILENRVGYVVPPGDVESLARCLIEVSGRIEENRAAGERARRLATSRYDRSIVTSEFGELLDDVVTGVSRA